MLDLGADAHLIPDGLSGLGSLRSISPLLSALRGWLVCHFQLPRITVLTADQVGENRTDTSGL
jgi:hypothetical protein